MDEEIILHDLIVDRAGETEYLNSEPFLFNDEFMIFIRKC